MAPQQNRVLGTLMVVSLVSVGLAACSVSPGDGGSGGTPSSGGTSASGGSGAGGTVSTGGSVASGGTSASGGSVASGGVQSGGTVGSGGSSNSGGTTPVLGTGGATVSGTGGSGKGGASSGTGGTVTMGTGGRPQGTGGTVSMGTGGRSGAGGTTNAGTGGSNVGGAAGCQKGQVKATEVVIMGESFYAMSPQYIQKRIESNAKKAGAIGANDSYRNVAVSGQPMSYIASTEWNGVKNSTVKFVIMDGGGIDCMSSACDSCPSTFKTLLGQMPAAGVQNVLYTRYPEPGNPPGSNATLKKNLDTLMPKMEEVCKASTSPRCYWVDLRPVWVNGDTSDGLHPTQSGGDHVGDLIWSEMVKNCLAQ
jgi:hypothetical protein